MSELLSDIRTRVMAEIRQLDRRAPTFSVVECDQVIRNTYFAIQSRLPANHAYVSSAGTITAGLDTFALPTTTALQYMGDIRLRIQSTGRFLDRLTVEELDRFRARQLVTTTGTPMYFCVWEEIDQTIQGRCYPRPQATETYDLYRSLVSADFDLTAMDSTSIRLSRFGATALVLKSAAHLIGRMTPEQLKLRDLNPGIISDLVKDYEDLIYQEGVRRNRIASTGRTHRMVS